LSESFVSFLYFEKDYCGEERMNWMLPSWTNPSAPVLYTFLSLLVIILIHASVSVCFFLKEYVRFQPHDSLVDSGLSSETRVHLSVIVPAYNEEERIPTMLAETVAHLESKEYNWEIVIVDDGSVDGTIEACETFRKTSGLEGETLRVITGFTNMGKGAAVRRGVLASRGDHVLMVDADGATRFSDIDFLMQQMGGILEGRDPVEKDAIVIGSRAHLLKDEEVMAERTVFRNIMMNGFQFLVHFFCLNGIDDSQCGFKLFTRSTALKIFPTVHVRRWAFDVEVLYKAQRLKIPIIEIPVKWTEIEGSKLNVISASFSMLRDIVLIPFLYRSGIWKMA
jgi:dolichyl-phosphate beta-glucosyltransferase